MKAVRLADGMIGVSLVQGLGEGKVLLDRPNLGSVHQSGTSKGAFALAGLLLEDVTLTLLATQDLARTGHLETLGNSLTSLVDTTFTSHGGEIIHVFVFLARKICIFYIFFAFICLQSLSKKKWPLTFGGEGHRKRRHLAQLAQAGDEVSGQGAALLNAVKRVSLQNLASSVAGFKRELTARAA